MGCQGNQTELTTYATAVTTGSQQQEAVYFRELDRLQNANIDLQEQIADLTIKLKRATADNEQVYRPIRIPRSR